MLITNLNTTAEQYEQMSDSVDSNEVQNSVVVSGGAAMSMSSPPMLGCEQPSNETIVNDLLATNSETISCVTVSVPLTTDEVILPLLDNQFCDLAEDSENRVLECTSREALEVIESTLSSDKKLRFQAALISGVNTKIDNDPLYQSWKHYAMLVHGSFPRSNVTKQSSVPATFSSNTPVSVQHEENNLYSSQSESIPSAHTVASQVFPMPKPTKNKRIANNEYFVMTADEIVQEKRKAFDMKKKELEAKQIKREERNKKKIEKALKKSDKSYKKNVKATEISITEML